MRRCLCCGLPCGKPLCGLCADALLPSWTQTPEHRYWRAVAIDAMLADYRRREQVYHP